MRRCAGLVIAVLLFPRAAAPAEPAGTAAPVYTEVERGQLRSCSALGVIALVTARARLQGVTEAELRAEYEGKPTARLGVFVVERVFREAPADPRAFSVGLVEQCAAQVLGFPAAGDARVARAGRCGRRVTVAGDAYEARAAGSTKEKVIRLLGTAATDDDRRTVERVFGASGDRGLVLGTEWERCLDGHGG